MHNVVQPNQWVVLKLPSDSTQLLQIVPDTTISLGKYGSFPSNLIIHRPYHLTYEVQDKRENESFSRLRVVPAAELHADALASSHSRSEADDLATATPDEDVVEVTVPGRDDEKSVAISIGRSNRKIFDEPARQTLTMSEIEALKLQGSAAGRDLIAKLMQSHTALDLKTEFSLAKYKLLKTRKYIRRFTVLPLDALELGRYMLEEKDAAKVLEIREETMSLVNSWANVHFGGEDIFETGPKSFEQIQNGDGETDRLGRGRWLVVDDTGGLLVAAMAERMGILHPPEPDRDAPLGYETQSGEAMDIGEAGDIPVPLLGTDFIAERGANGAHTKSHIGSLRRKRPPPGDDLTNLYSLNNTITLLHPHSQPNLILLRFFNFAIDNPTQSYPPHPLASHIIPVTWLQLLNPSLDTTLTSDPPAVPEDELATWKPTRRGHYYRKRRRWRRIRHAAAQARAGDFAGLAVATAMDPVSVLREALPLLAGGAPVAVYSPTVEPLVRLADCFSAARRTAWAARLPDLLPGTAGAGGDGPAAGAERWPGSDEFPVNPTLLLGTGLQTARARRWQVLPGRTHPLMMGRGGPEGYVFTGWRALPAEGRVEGRGKFTRRKTEA